MRREDFTNPTTGRTAIIWTSNEGTYEVFFGQTIDGEWVASMTSPSKVYKSAAGALRAATRWIA